MRRKKLKESLEDLKTTKERLVKAIIALESLIEFDFPNDDN